MELNRQYYCALFTRRSLTRDGSEVLRPSIEGQLLENQRILFQDRYILEFIGLPDRASYSESELESKLIEKLEHFILELGTLNLSPGRTV
ncbi:PDDEXK nuclease domain-containing protein [Flavobacterium psychrotrophum]|uniref:PDDEXK nuclease domain-containing protein n=1 Tax=Flavobacterium psychrotrophum TaxID=2294119 RepID=UPI0019697ABA